MISTRTTWQSKLDRVQEWKVVPGGKRTPGTMLIPTPRQIDSLMREIPVGAVSSVRLLGQALAKRHGADITCPLCTGMFVRIAAEAAEEQRRAGEKEITPYWRVVDKKGRHNPKWPGGEEGQSALLEDEVRSLLGR